MRQHVGARDLSRGQLAGTLGRLVSTLATLRAGRTGTNRQPAAMNRL